MLDKKLLTILAVLLCGFVLMAGYNRPYRWWPVNDMSEQEYIKAFTENSGRAPAEGTVAVGAWDDAPPTMEMMTSMGNHATFKKPEGLVADEASIKRGEELFTIYCWPCHGTEMSPDPAKFSPVKAGSIPGRDSQWGMPAADTARLKAGPFYTDEYIYAAITHGSASKVMKRQSYHLSPDERWDVVHYVRSLVDNYNQ